MTNYRTSRRGRRSKKRKLRLGKVLLLALILCLCVFLYQQVPLWLSPAKYSSIIQEQAAANGIDPLLVCAIIKSESSFQPDSVSKAGAVGLMQLMPDTAEWIAKKKNIEYNVDKLTDPAYNISLGCWYLDYLLDTWENDLPKTIASYNAGRSNVINWLEESIWDGSEDTVDDIPFPETRRYTGKVLKSYEEYTRLYAEDQRFLAE